MSLKGARVMHVQRGNLELVMPIRADAFAAIPVHELAMLIAKTMLRQQNAAPGQATAPIPVDDTPLALRVNGRERLLDPDLSLREQTEGRWEWRDLPVQGQTEQTARLPVCEFELVDVDRPRIRLP